MTEQRKTVHGAIQGVMDTLAAEGIGKSRFNEMQKYKFRGIDDILNALARALVDNGLVIVPSYADRQVIERQTKSGGTLFYVTLQGTYQFFAADGSKLTAGPFFGEAMDSGDKATIKALSAAYKSMALQLFCIPTEGDHDAETTSHEVGTPWTDDLRDLAVEAAAKGMKEYQAFWSGLSEETRAVLIQTKEHSQYKHTATTQDATKAAKG